MFFVTPVLAASAPARTLCDLENIIVGIFDKIWPVIGVALFLMYVYGGAMWQISGGDPAKLQKAQGTLMWATVGVFILAVIMWVMGVMEQLLGMPAGSLRGFTLCGP